MEYDKSTTVPTNTPLETLPASNQHTAEQPRHQTSSNSSNNNNSSSNNNSDNETNQHIRVASKPDVDISVLGTPITFAFCGKTAPNRFLKAPMTERLCRWNDEGRGEDVVSSLFFLFSLSISSIKGLTVGRYPLMTVSCLARLALHCFQSTINPNLRLTSSLLTMFSLRHTEATRHQNTPSCTSAGARARSAQSSSATP